MENEEWFFNLRLTIYNSPLQPKFPSATPEFQ